MGTDVHEDDSEQPQHEPQRVANVFRFLRPVRGEQAAAVMEAGSVQVPVSVPVSGQLESQLNDPSQGNGGSSGPRSALLVPSDDSGIELGSMHSR